MKQLFVSTHHNHMSEDEELLPPWLFTPLHREFARFVGRRYGASEGVRLAAALTVRALDEGSTCLDLEAVAGTIFEDESSGGTLKLPSLDTWMEDLRRSSAVALHLDQRRPLVLTGHLTALHRYRGIERRLARFFHQASQYHDAMISPELFHTARRLFSGADETAPPLDGGDLQCAGAFLPFYFRSVVITGGPGTGKTTVLARMLLLQCEAGRLAGKPLPEMVLAAPTGKAAQRMSDSLRRALEDDTVTRCISPEVIEHVRQAQPLTMHRLLGIAPGREPRKNAANPLECDIAVLDECSMVDVLLMKMLVDALPEKSRLILLGDRDQLPSIEAGRVSADLCEWQPINGFTHEFASVVNKVIQRKEDHIEPNGNYLSPIVELRHSYRFDSTLAIGTVAGAVNRGDSERALDTLTANVREGAASFCRLMDNPGREALFELMGTLYRPLVEATDPRHALEALEKAMVLTALNEGFLGRTAINEVLDRRFPRRAATPIIVTVNDPRRNLSNGDMGVLLREGSDSRAWFAHLDEPLSRFNLPPYEKAFAITIHKSQGSEFEEIVIMLPNGGPLLSRELLYTAVTRARKRCTIVGKAQVVEEAVGHRCDRRSGFGDELISVGLIRP